MTPLSSNPGSDVGEEELLPGVEGAADLHRHVPAAV